jgi:hypothetical protein
MYMEYVDFFGEKGVASRVKSENEQGMSTQQNQASQKAVEAGYSTLVLVLTVINRLSLLVIRVMYYEPFLQLLYVAGWCIVARYINELWYTTIFTIPAIQPAAQDVLSDIETYVKPFYLKMTDPNEWGGVEPREFDVIFPDLIQIRAMMQRFLISSYPHIEQAANGITYRFIPAENFLSIIAFIPPFIIAIFIILQLFESVYKLINSFNFWAIAIIFNAVAVFVVYFCVDTHVSIIGALVPTSKVITTYTTIGRTCVGFLITSLVVCLFLCYLMYTKAVRIASEGDLTKSQKSFDDETIEMASKKQWQTPLSIFVGHDASQRSRRF